MNSYDEVVKKIEYVKQEGLKELDLSADINNPDDYRLSNIPEEVFDLVNLEALIINNCKIDQIPREISNLKNLRKLEVSGNDISTLPSTFFDLSNLETLDVSYNHLKEIPKNIANLRNLQRLNVGWNELSNLPVEIIQLETLTSLSLEENPLVSPPQEIVERGIDAIKIYLRQISEGVNYLYEAKLIVVGEGGAGKTTLVHKILNPTYQMIDEPTTHGVSISKWDFIGKDSTTFRVNIWDFGGQEIYHATHQLFMTNRSLYVLVADTRKEDTDFYYWLNMIEILGDDSPIIIVKNEKHDRMREINERKLRGQYSNIKAVISVNLENDRGVDYLIDEIKHYIQRLPHIGTAIPKSWGYIRNALENENKNFITLEEYLSICMKNGVLGIENALQISSYLHDEGTIFHFQQDPLLRKILILNTDWLTGAMYMVLDNSSVIRNFGRFSIQDLRLIWGDSRYSKVVDELLQLMLYFRLCYPVPGVKGVFISPQLVKSDTPMYQWDASENSHLRFRYEFMPKGIMSQLIVVMHQYIKGDLIWGGGVVIEFDGTLAEIIEFYGKREIQIRVAGTNKQELLKIINYELQKIHNTYRRLIFSALIPCNCESCQTDSTPYFYSLDVLRKFIEDSQYSIQCQKSYRMVNVKNLLLGIMSEDEYKADAPQPLYEAKLLIVGEPGAGKTSLMKKLVDSAYTVPSKEESTVGITIRPWVFKIPANQNIEFMANIWDFGGQEIQYALHHFFLTSRALYILVADDREQRTEFDYWFRIINLLGDNSPVLVVLNENNTKSITNFDYDGYVKRYESLVIERRDVDLANNDGRFDSLKLKIEKMLYDLGHVKEPVPSGWKMVRSKLKELQSKKKYISIEDYFDVCNREGIIDENEQLKLSNFLHDLGVVLHFQKEGDLFNILILNPSWAVDGAYAILANHELEEMGGRFSKNWIFNVLKNMGYSFQERNYLLNLMKKDVFELCYQLPQNDEFIAPKLLPKKKPSYEWDNDGNLCFQYQYPFMPKGIISRLMVRLSEYIATDQVGKDIVWSKGMVVSKGTAKAEVVEDVNKKGVNVIKIQVHGNDSKVETSFDKKDLLTIVRDQLLQIHGRSFGKIKFDQLIPCNCKMCKTSDDPELYTTIELNRFIENSKKIQCRHSFEDVDPISLVEDVIGLDRYKEEQSRQGTPINIHIHQGEEQVSNTTVNITNSNTGNLIINSSVQNSFNEVVSSDVSSELKETLKSLSIAVDEMIKNLPKEKADEVADDLRTLVKEATKESPRKEHLKVTAEGLIKAAENIGKIGEPVIKLAGKIIALFVASGL